MIEPQRQPGRGTAGSPLANGALVLGIIVALVTTATQTRRFGQLVGDVFGGDLLNVAYFGLAAAGVATAAAT